MQFVSFVSRKLRGDPVKLGSRSRQSALFLINESMRFFGTGTQCARARGVRRGDLLPPYKGPEASRKRIGKRNPNPVPAKLRTVERLMKFRPYKGPETSRKRTGTGGPSSVPVKLRTVERSAGGASTRDELPPLHTRPL